MSSSPTPNIHVFIDANILLSFWEYTDDDLRAILTVVEGLKENRITPYVNDQLYFEVLRNRETKISSAVKKLKEQKLDIKIPALFRGYPETEELLRLQKEYSNCHRKLLQTLATDSENDKFLPDEVMSKYFTIIGMQDTGQQILDLARERVDRNNPPYKSSGIGDAIHWEWLLKVVPGNTDIHLISMDKDFASELYPKKINAYLAWEWHHVKNGMAYLHDSLTSFFDLMLPGVKLPTDFRRPAAIEKFINSGSYKTTHEAIEELSKIPLHNPDDAELIFRASLENTQIQNILTDPDVRAYLKSLIPQFARAVDPKLVKSLKLAIEEDFPERDFDSSELVDND